jgi:hypothetical protein
VQVGLLDPKLVPEGMKGKGVDLLPVVGRELARGIVGDGRGRITNQLIPGWRKGGDKAKGEGEQPDQNVRKGDGDGNAEEF